jgi:hypothetical protein
MGGEMSLPAVSLAEAEATLRSLVPLAGSRQKYAFDPDDVRRAALGQGAIDNVWPISGVEDRSDSELLTELMASLDVEHEPVVIVPGDSFRPSSDLFRKALSLDGSQLQEFVRDYHARTGRYIFDGDTIFLFPKSRQIVMLHHEGFGIRLKM